MIENYMTENIPLNETMINNFNINFIIIFEGEMTDAHDWLVFQSPSAHSLARLIGLLQQG